MQITLTDIERESYKNSPIHRLDGRVKILATIAIIVFAVSLPRIDEGNFIRLAIIEAYLLLLVLLARLNILYVLVRFIAVLPFGLSMVLIQPFVRQPFIDTFRVYAELPLGITMTYEGTYFGLTLLAKYIVCVTSIVLLSSTMKMNDMVVSARRLGIPREFTLLLTMMVRYLFVFWIMLKRIRTAQQTRLFDIWNKNAPRRWVLEQVGYTISSLFIRSYEQGERTYISMLCRGYGNDTNNIYMRRSKLRLTDAVFFLSTAMILVLLAVM
ncbi:cobalt ECF transporter T component CbiQ [Methanolobus sp.]|uniref:cobalt ECF transporter T component CbiQ n=1 Tax=Methanolobus sp. TaxID=1874737 RepID=UPI0025D4491A|nr:cobalt ECF transporter T component CbiQ [Methanolobus sp.]